MTEQHIDVETTVTEIVKSLGGESVDELLAGQADKPLNADYLFRTENVVAELKRLEKDLSEDPAHQAAVQRLFEDFEREGLLKIYGTVKIDARKLPQECAYRLTDLYKGTIEQHVRKANRQIKSTKKHFDIPAAKGLLIVAHDGNFGLEPEGAVNLVARCLKGPYHNQIDWLIYFTANMSVGLPGTDSNILPVVTAPRKKTTVFPKELPSKIVEKWNEIQSARLGVPITKVKGRSPQDLDHLKFRR